jgi:hypothetical protein
MTIPQFHADVVVIATGFKHPDMDFLPKEELFPEGYDVGRFFDFSKSVAEYCFLRLAAELVPPELLH